MAMGAVRGQAATLQVEMVCLDELVPEDDRSSYVKSDELGDSDRPGRSCAWAQGRSPCVTRA